MREHKVTVGKWIEILMITACAGATISLVNWLFLRITEKGVLTTVTQLGTWSYENTITATLLCVAVVLFGFFGKPYVIAKLEEPASFLSRLGLIVVGSLVLICMLIFGSIAWNFLVTALISTRP